MDGCGARPSWARRTSRRAFRARFFHNLSYSKARIKRLLRTFQHTLFSYIISYSRIFPILKGSRADPRLFRGQHSHGTCRPKERPSARTATFSGDRRAKEHDSHPGERADGSQGRGSAVSRHRSRSRPSQQMCGVGGEKRLAHAAGEEVLRDHQVASGDRHSHRGGQGRREGRRRPIRLANADAAARRFSDAARRRRCGDRDVAARGAQGDGRQDAVCDHRRGHAVFSERRAVRRSGRTR